MGQLAIACGGTGGHLFPGLAVAEAVRRRGHEVRFFISSKPVDRRALAGAGEEAHGIEIPATGWSGVLGAGRFLVHLVAAVREAREEMKNFHAGALLGMGG
ncbi:MAG: glycosyltransferase, partial [Verrucomicrobia bacterium]|nr:glycosyltransferase [Verrucomicrobiota bacterium]